VYTTKGGLNVWLVERHALPIVAVTVAVPSGSAKDPAAKGGLAWATANMLDEGAGKRGAIELARATDTLGATLKTGSSADWSYASLTVIKRNLAEAMPLLGDVVVRPRFEAVEWKRVHDLWVNQLKNRASDPQEVAVVVGDSVLYGGDHPYGHAVDGSIASASKVTLADAKSFYQAEWTRGRATVVVVGDATRGEIDPMLDAAFAGWAPPAAASPAGKVPAPSGLRPKVVLVDRPDAPQSVIRWIRLGPTADHPDSPALGRVNSALGGSFTSRLNQDLREEHGWSYGAHSRVEFTRGPGRIVATAAVHTEKTGEALKALLADVAEYAKGGMTDEEVKKTRLIARSDLIELFETAGQAALRLGRDAALGLGSEYEAKASIKRDQATKEELGKLAASWFDANDATIVIVGPRAKIAPQLEAAGLPAPEMRDAEGGKK
jgi:predicted Zn-dependent peptidase